MSFQIRIDKSELKKLEKKIGSDFKKAIPLATRRALIKGRAAAWVETGKMVKKDFRRAGALPAATVKTMFMKNTRSFLRGEPDAMRIEFQLPRNTFSVQRFRMGPRKPPSQKKKTSNRKNIVNPAKGQRAKLKIRIVDGRNVTLKSSFVAKASGKFRTGPNKGKQNYQVYQRRNNKAVVRRTHAISNKAAKYFRYVIPKIETKMQKEFNRQMRLAFR